MIGDRKKSVFGALLLLALFGAVFYASWMYLKPKPEAAHPGSFGAIAMSTDSGIYGAAWGFHDPDTAIERARSECTRSGGANCIVKASLNGNCGSLVTSGHAHQSYVVTDSDKYQAAAFGLAQCQASGAGDCTVREQFCGSGG
ncbi:MAG: DUF4189 domain-containing protein [Alphaproteobacteria bacterium]|nr:DUF4189 domain-containing protein [Alphaproteobacteria bacterium]